MKNLLFNFESPSEKDRAVRQAESRFARAGAPVVSSSVDKTTSRRAGMTFRNVHFTCADGQTVTMAFKASGDVFEVRINGKVTPLRHQEDHALAITEVVEKLEKGRSAFQKALTRVRMPLPPSIRTSRGTLLRVKQDRRDALKEAIAVAEQTLAELSTAPAAP